MATLIRLKRKTTPGNNNVVLAAGEAYYNLSDKELYVGNSDGESVDSNKKHIAQITIDTSVGDNTIAFSIGEGSKNRYEKTIKVDSLNWKDYEK